jgi:hypothetical protein
MFIPKPNATTLILSIHLEILGVNLEYGFPLASPNARPRSRATAGDDQRDAEKTKAAPNRPLLVNLNTPFENESRDMPALRISKSFEITSCEACLGSAVLALHLRASVELGHNKLAVS